MTLYLESIKHIIWDHIARIFLSLLVVAQTWKVVEQAGCIVCSHGTVLSSSRRQLVDDAHAQVALVVLALSIAGTNYVHLALGKVVDVILLVVAHLHETGRNSNTELRVLGLTLVAMVHLLHPA